jgi:2'-5' RNA ligase
MNTYWINLDLPYDLEVALQQLGVLGQTPVLAMPLHITIVRKFYWQGAEADLIRLIDQIAQPLLPLTLVTGNIGIFPKGEARHGYVDILEETGQLDALYRRIVAQGGTRLRFNRYQFRPHVNLVRDIRKSIPTDSFITAAQELLPETFEGTSVSLLRSIKSCPGNWQMIHHCRQQVATR